MIRRRRSTPVEPAPTSRFTQPLGIPVGSTERAKVPTVLQMQVTECGAACLGKVLAYYGRWVSLEELRDRCGASRDGTSAADLIRAGEHYGLQGKGFYKTRDLLVPMGFPLILLWKGAHFVVLEGLDSEGAWLNDPASGPRRISLAEFDNEYTNICLALRPTDDFAKGGRPPGRLDSLIRRGRPVLPQVLAVVAVGLLATVPGLVLAAVGRLFVDDVLIRGDTGSGWPLVGAAAVALGVQLLMQMFQQRVLVDVGTRLTISESARFVRHTLRLPERYFIMRSVSDLAQRVQHNREVVTALTGQLASVLVSAIVVAVYAVALFFVDVPLAVLAVGLSFGNLLALRFVLAHRRERSRLLVVEQSAMAQTTAYGAMTLETIKAGGLESDYYARWDGGAVRLSAVRQELAMSTELGNAVPGTIRSLISALVLGFGAYRVIGGDLEIGSLVAFQALVGSFIGPLGQLVGFAWLIQHVQNLIRRLDDVLDEPEDPACDPAVQNHDFVVDLDAGGEPRLVGAACLRNVSFGYKSTAAPLISEFDLDVPPGSRVAVVGTSGSGKSTIVRLLAGLYQPWDGEALLDGRQRRDIPRQVLTASVAMVDQRIALFAGTVRDNLTLWDASVPDDDVIRAAMDAQIHHDIASRAGGYSSLITDGGANWSGGQRQRLEIARALVRNPSVLLLDEATSALDADTEAAVETALRRRGCTTLVVAHRLSTVRDADRIVVVEKGRIVESGRHDDLLARDGSYAKLVKA